MQLRRSPGDLVGEGSGTIEVADEELQANKGEALGEYDQAVGDDVEPLYRLATTIDEDARAWVREFLQTEHGVTF